MMSARQGGGEKSLGRPGSAQSALRLDLFRSGSSAQWRRGVGVMAFLLTLGWIGSTSGLAQQILFTTSGSSINKISPARSVSTFVSGFSQTEGLVFDSAGNLYVADNNGGSSVVYKVTPGGSVSTYATGVGISPWGMAFDSLGNLFVSDNNATGNIYKIALGGSSSVFVTGVSYGFSIAIDASNNLYVPNLFGTTVKKITPAGSISVFASGFNSPAGLAFDPSGNLMVVNVSGVVSKVTPGGSVSTFISGLNNPYGVAIDATGNLFIGNYNTSIYEVTPGGGVSTFVSVSGLMSEGSLAFAPIPESSTYATLFGLTAFGFAAYRRRNRRAV